MQNEKNEKWKLIYIYIELVKIKMTCLSFLKLRLSFFQSLFLSL